MRSVTAWRAGAALLCRSTLCGSRCRNIAILSTWRRATSETTCSVRVYSPQSQSQLTTFVLASFWPKTHKMVNWHNSLLGWNMSSSNENVRKLFQLQRALSRAHLPPTKVFPRLAVNKTLLKPRLAAATGGQYVYVGFSRRNKIPRYRLERLYDIGESSPVLTSGLWSGSDSKVNQFVYVPTSVDTQHFIQIHARVSE